MPFQRNRFHYNWRWWHNFGNGDIGNHGMYEIDYARWGLGVDTLPSTIAGLGGKYFFDDDQEFPDRATITFEYSGDGKVGPKRQLIFEMRLWSTNYRYNCDNGLEFYGTKGRLMVSKRGQIQVLDERNRRVEAKPKEPPKLIGGHVAASSMRSRRAVGRTLIWRKAFVPWLRFTWATLWCDWGVP